MSYNSAVYLGKTGLKSMQERGRVQVGKIADLTIFDAEKVAPRASYKVGENGLPPVGIPYVVVSGKIVVKNSKVQNVNAGQPIRFPVEDKGRFEPVTVNGWMGQHTLNVPAGPSIDTTNPPKALEDAAEGATAPQKGASSAPAKKTKASLPSDSGNKTVGIAASWFGDSVGPHLTGVACCSLHDLLRTQGGAAK
ncbi:MAG: hypothetical protein HC841_09820 [Verrucomicrobiae bacterium]|nr:hypothetical protein [Verrucomicrobiae bacterium]